jgi:hypothetical protein
VEDCPKRFGGSAPGFKRKNELVRHQLIHKELEFRCPWCNKGHTYARPDNLQRHVKTTHPEKEQDEALIKILEQANNGKKRRRSRKHVDTETRELVAA